MDKKNIKKVLGTILFLSLLFFNFISVVSVKTVQASTTVLVNENFDNYGKYGTVPSGWTFYGSIGNYKLSGSDYALSFGTTGQYIITPALTNPYQLSFYINGSGTDSNSYLKIEQYIGTSWSTVQTVKPIPTNAPTLTYSLSSSATKVRFTYTKSTGSVWLDDVYITGIIPVTGVTLDKTAVSDMQAGTGADPSKTTAQLTATVAPSNATNTTVNWSSSNTSIATVDSTGLVTAVGAGTATITAASAADSTKYATCAVTVLPMVSVTGVTLDKTSLPGLEIGAGANTSNNTAQLTATIAPSNASYKNVTWSSSNTSVATVSSTGLVTAVGAGTATITATSASDTTKKATSAVTVTTTTLPTFSSSTTTQTAGPVNVTISYSSNAAGKKYSVDGVTWLDYVGPVTMKTNGTIQAKSISAAGNDSLTSSFTVSNIDPNNGNWTLTSLTLKNTPEAALMVRAGDIDNFGFGWAANFDPFSGNSTAVHSFPWKTPSTEPAGLDRIMVVSGYNYSNPATSHTDGYTSSTKRSDTSTTSNNTVTPINLTYDLSGVTVNNAVLQLFVDDFQAGTPKGIVGGIPVKYQVTINNQQVPELAAMINALDQSGPIGKLISFTLPDTYLGLIKTGNINIKIDDPTSGGGDGYAIDFAKLLINQTGVTQYGSVSGNVTDASKGTPLSGVVVTADGSVSATTDANGNYSLSNVISGYATITATKDKFQTATTNVDVKTNTNSVLNFSLVPATQPGLPTISENPNTPTNKSVIITITYPDSPPIMQYSFDGITWLNYTGPVTMAQNGTIYAKSAWTSNGPWSNTASLTINNIDTSIPPAPILTPSTTALTNQPVTITLSYPTGVNVQAGTTYYSTDTGNTWLPYNGPFTVSANATVEGKYNNVSGTTSLNGYLVVNNIDTISPTVTNVTSSIADGSYNTGTLIQIQVTFSEPVNVTGTPQLDLNTNEKANYSSGSGTNTLTFNYTVQMNDSTTDLNYKSTASLLLNGGSIKDAATNNADLTLPSGTGSLAANKNIVIVTTPPIGSVVINNGDQYTNNPQVTLTLQASGVTQMMISQDPGFAGASFENYATSKNITLSSGDGTKTVYVKFKDAASNVSAVISDSIILDTTSPTVTNVTSALANGTYGLNTLIPIQVVFSENVFVTGTPQLKLNTGGTASYSSGSGTNTLTFNYIVGANENTSDLNYSATNSLILNGGSIADAATNNSILTLPNLTASGSLGTNKAIVVDTTAPYITNVTSSKADGAYTSGASIPISITFNEIVNVTGTPQLTLNTGETVNYVSGSGTNTLQFTYIVKPGDNTTDLNYSSTNALALNSGTIQDMVNNNADLTLPALNGAGSLGTNKAIVIDTTAPYVTNVTSSKADGSYGIGASIPISITFNKIVNVTGTPQLTLNTGETVNYVSGSGTNTLQFTYIVKQGDNTPDLNYSSTSALTGSIQDTIGNTADLTLPALNGAGSLGTNKAIVIDAITPIVTNVTSSKADGTYGSGTSIPISITFNKIVNVTGTPQLTLNTGETVSYVGGSGTNTLQFTYIVKAGDNTPDLNYSSTSALTGSIQDAIGNTADLTLPALNGAGSLGTNKAIVIDAITPIVTNVTSSKADGTYGSGTSIPISITFNKIVNVTGTPQLTLNTGETVNYVSGSGTNTLQFTYIVKPGDNTPDLNYSSTSALTGSIQDAIGNTADLTLPALNGAGSLGTNKAIVIDAITPIVTNVTSSKADGTYGIGASIPISITFSKIVNVTGTPQLTLNTGETVNYVSGSGTNTLQFTYIVKPGDNTPDLNYSSTSALTGSIQDAIGNTADLTLPALNGAGSLGTNKAIVIDAITPIVTNVTSSKADGTYGIGASIPISITFSKIVNVTGTPQLTLNTGETVNYVSGSGTNTLQFTYIVKPGDNTPDLNYSSTSALTGSIQDAIGNTADLTLPALNGAGSLGTNKAIVIDAITPIVTNVTSSKADGTYGIGASIPISITFNKVVNVTGTPQLTLNTGETVNYVSGSGTNTLQFTYIVKPGDNTPDLNYSSTSALTGFIQDAIGNTADLTLPALNGAGSLGTNKAIVIDAIAPSITNVTSSKADGTYGIGASIPISITFNKIVNVTGTPQLTLNTGETVNYVSGSGTNTLQFTYIVKPGDNTPDLNYSSTSALTGSIQDAVGNTADLTLPALNRAGSLGTNKAIVIDAIAPYVTNVTSSKVDGTYGNGASIPITITFSKIVNVTGTPQITLNTGETVNYVGGSGTNTLQFTYIVKPGDNTPDLNYSSTSALVLNGGSIQDLIGNAANLTLPALSGAGSLGTNKAIVIDAIVPYVTNVTSSKADGTYGIGTSIPISITFNKIVNVTGTPQLTLNTGETVNYVGGSGTNTLQFTYIVKPGDNAADLNYNSTNALTLNGGSIQDSTGNTADLTLPALNGAGSLGTNKAIAIDAIVPYITNVTSSKADGIYGYGTSIPISITFNKIVNVTGTPQLTLNTGETVNYVSGSGTNTLQFTYIVKPGDNTPDLNYSSANALTLNGGSIQDTIGNTANLTLPAINGAGSLGTNKAIVIDAIAPNVTNVTSSKADGTYGNGASIPISITFNKIVNVIGTPQLTLNTGETVNYVGGSGTNTIQFTYIVKPGDNTPDLNYSSINALTLNGGSIQDTIGNTANLTLPAINGAGSLGTNKAIVIDAIAPYVTNVTSSKADGTYGNGASIPVSITFSKIVNVTGTPQLTLNTGETINYVSGSGTNTLQFTYIVKPGDNTPDLNYSSANALTLNGGSIQDTIGNTANLTLPAINGAGSLGTNKAIVIDAIAPSVTSVTSSKTDGTYGNGASIPISITFSKIVNVTGTPQLTLNTGETVNYVSGSGLNTLQFTYIVKPGDNTPDLNYSSTNALTLNGGSIQDTFGNTADLTLPAIDGAGSLGTNKDIIISTTLPYITNVTSSIADGTYGTGASIPISITFNKIVNVTGTPQLTLNTGETIDYVSGSGTNTLIFNYIVKPGDNTDNLNYSSTSALSLNGGTIEDTIGNTADLKLPALNGAGSLGTNKAIVIDTTAPTITNVTSSKANGTYGSGTSIPISITFDKAVNVTGTPQLSLNSGGTADYVSGSGTNTLQFVYIVKPGDSASDLNYSSTSALSLNDGTIEDTFGNTADLTLPDLNGTGSLGTNKTIVINTTAPYITNVTSNKADGSYGVGASIPISITFDKTVNVTGTPQLSLNTGEKINYSSGSGTNTLQFIYIVKPGDNTHDLNYSSTNALTLNGGTIKDTLGNEADLTLPPLNESGSLGTNKDIIIDTTAPEPPIISAENKNGKTTVTISSGENGVTIKYSYDNNLDIDSWTTYTGPLTLTSSATIYAVAVDSVGNVSDIVSSSIHVVNMNNINIKVSLSSSNNTSNTIRTVWFDCTGVSTEDIASILNRNTDSATTVSSSVSMISNPHSKIAIGNNNIGFRKKNNTTLQAGINLIPYKAGSNSVVSVKIVVGNDTYIYNITIKTISNSGLS